MLDNKHEAMFPPTGNCTLWRYTDLTKLLSLLENHQLFFPRADQFDDPYEGAFSRAGVALARKQAQKSGFPAKSVEMMIRNAPRFREGMFISCWNAAEYESAAMWKLYLQSPEGVAIRADHQRLCAVLEKSPLMARTSMVQYIDYDQAPVPMNNGFFPFVHKRLSFAHESELRAIIWSWEDVNQKQIAADATSVSIDVEPKDLIQAIHVSPSAPLWFGRLVEQLARRYGLDVPVIRSTLYDRPAY
ncbi:MAG: hypothetical protein HY018_06115 [Hydrogenophilales bacterium]|nr:hypothetical protein [Hydrogenophilales bacterium]